MRSQPPLTMAMDGQVRARRSAEAAVAFALGAALPERHAKLVDICDHVAAMLVLFGQAARP